MASYNVTVKISVVGAVESLEIHEWKLYKCLESEMSETGHWQLHASPTCGHFRVTKTFARICERLLWPHCHQVVGE